MNRATRGKIGKILTQLDVIREELQEIQEEESMKFYNMSEGLQESENGQKMYRAAEALEDVGGTIEEAYAALEEIRDYDQNQ